MPKCKYYKKMKYRKYFRCKRDNSIRKHKFDPWSDYPCKCPHFKLRLIDKIKGWGKY